MKKLSYVALCLLLLSGCAQSKYSHPTKSESVNQGDYNNCFAEAFKANLKDSNVVLDNHTDQCMKALGYVKKANGGLAYAVRDSLNKPEKTPSTDAK